MVCDIDDIGFGGIVPRRINFVGGFLRVGFSAADGSDARAVTGQTHGDGVPNPPPCSGDYCDLIFELHKAGHDRPRVIGEQSRSDRCFRRASRSGGLETAGPWSWSTDAK